MKLLILTQAVDRNDPNLGAFYLWYEELAKRFDSLTIVALRVGAHGLPQNVRVISAGKEKGRGKLTRRFRFIFAGWVQVLRHDAVFVHMIPEYVLAIGPLTGLLRKKVFLWYAHGAVPFSLRLALPFVRKVFTSSSSGFRVITKKSLVVGQAIDTKLFSPGLHEGWGGYTSQMVSVGRISPVKGIDRMLEALVHLPEYSLTLVGEPITAVDEGYLDLLRGKAESLNVAERVHFVGGVPHADLPTILSKHETFLNLSSTGSLDKAVLEAMAMGLHVVTGNEAFAALVPKECFVPRGEGAEELARRIRVVGSRPLPEEMLREVVVVGHGIEATLDRISTAIYES